MSRVADWKRISARLKTMSRAELADRLRQQTTARLDFWSHKAGAGVKPRFRSLVAGAAPQFFFSPEQVPELCSCLRQLFPDTARQIIQRAERISEHRFDLLGHEALDYGAEIDWHSDRVHGKRAPLKPWFQINYLDFAEVGDSKVTWELNRHQHLVTLAKAYRLTGDQNFAAELFRQWEHWHAKNPYPIGINWASSLEVAFRSLSWIWVYFLLADSAALPMSFRRSWLRSLAISGRHIEKYLSTYFSPNTHLLGEAVALFFIGVLCPEISSAARWQQRGWEIIQQQAARQVRADGFHFEQSSYYHVYALDFFLHSAVLASLNHVPLPAEFDSAMRRMLEALATLARSGAVPRLGDDDGGRLFDPSRNRAAHLLDPLATGAVLYQRGDFKKIAGGPREETLWLLGEAGIEEFENLPEASPSQDSAAFPATGLYVMAGSNPQRQFVVDAGPQGADTAGHGHADALSLTASVSGQEVLIDPGTFEYVGVNSDRDRFRGTRAHNTLLIAGRDQADPKGPFGWQRLPKIQAEGWISGKTFDLFVGSHDGYARLAQPVFHRRFVFALKSGFCLVRDLALGQGEYDLDLAWHIAPHLQAPDSGKDVFVGDHAGLRFVTAEGHGWARAVEEFSHSPVYGQQEKHSELHFATKAKLPAEFVTLLVPFAGESHNEHSLTGVAAESSPIDTSTVVAYRYRAAGQEHSVFFGQGEPWKLQDWSSDADFLYVRQAGSALAEIIACNASFVERDTRKLLTAQRPVLRCEIIAGDPLEVVCSDPEAVTVDREAWRASGKGDPQLVIKLS
jgi:hypothetical protein